MGAFEEYGYEFENVLHEAGARVVDRKGADVFDGLVLRAFLVFGERGLGHLWILERVVVEDGVARRARFSYHVEYDGDFLFRYDLDPVAHPENPMHKHVPDGRRIPWPAVSLPEVFEEVWGVVNEREDA
jgi:Family of unknown function (DUF6516)